MVAADITFVMLKLMHRSQKKNVHESILSSNEQYMRMIIMLF